MRRSSSGRRIRARSRAPQITRQERTMRRLARPEHPELVAAIGGDTVVNTIAVHGLLSGAFDAYVIGAVSNFTAAVVRPDYLPSEPFAWGDPDAIWRIASGLADWKCLEVP